MDAAQALRASPLFQSFTDTGIAIVAGICGPRSYPSGTPLFAENMVADSMLITTGQRLCTARATTGVTAFEIRQADFQKLTASKPQACMKLLMAICTTFGQKVQTNREALRTLVART